MTLLKRPVGALALWLAAAALSAADPAPVKLTLQEATRRALERNTTLAVERKNADQAAQAVAGARGAYDILWSADANWMKSTDPINSVFSGAPPGLLSPENESFEASTSFSRLLPTGGSVSLFSNWGRATTNGVFTILSPAYDTGVGISLRQPLLRSLEVDPAREAIRVASADRSASRARLERTVSDTMSRVDAAYWNLVATRRNVVSIESSIELADKQLSDTKTRVESGALAKTDVAEPTAELERRRGDLALARQQVEQAENTLKLLVLGDPGDPDWATEIVPADPPETALEHPSLPESLATARARRAEIAEANAQRERAEAQVAGRRSDVLPRLDLVASYQRRGLAGGANPAATNFNGEPAVVPRPLSGGTGRSLGTIGENRFPDAAVGLSLSLPIGNRTAKANLAIAQSRLSQAARRDHGRRAVGRGRGPQRGLRARDGPAADRSGPGVARGRRDAAHGRGGALQGRAVHELPRPDAPERPDQRPGHGDRRSDGLPQGADRARPRLGRPARRAAHRNRTAGRGSASGPGLSR